MKTAFYIILITAMTHAAAAQTNAPAKDFGAGFSKFYQLGLPDVTGGTYGRLDVIHYARAGAYDSMFSGRGDQLGLTGNAWKTTNLGAGSNRYVMGGIRVMDMMDEKTYAEWQKRQSEAMAKASATQKMDVAMQWEEPPISAGKWKDVDIRKDVVKVLKMLNNTSDDSPARWMQHDVQTGAGLLLAAAQLYRLGMKEEANTIAARLFAMHQENARQLLQGAVGLIAQEEYSKSYAAFRQSRDWAAWHGSLTNLMTKFSGSWPQAPGVKRLAELVKVRADQPEPPALAGEGLTDDDRKLARRLSTEAPPRSPYSHYGYSGDCWIFPQPHQRMQFGPGATNDAMLAIRERGMASIPMLVAMLKDNSLTLRDRGGGGEFFYGGMEFGRGQGEEQMAEMVFNSIQRPMTRSEIAKGMLQPLLIMDDRQRGELYRMSGEDMAAECEAWYKEYKGKTVDELARIYMEKGDQNQRQYAMNYLMRGKSIDANSAEIEKMLLAMVKESTDTPYVVQQYVQKRREKASNFVEQVAALMAATNAPSPATTDPRRRMVRRSSRGNERETFVKQLRDMVAVASVRDLLRDVLSGTGAVAVVQMKLQQQISREAPEESLSALLDAAQKTDDPMKRGILVSMVAGLKYARPGGWDDVDEEEAMDPATGAWKSNKFDPAKHAAAWNKLLEDKRGEDRTVAESAAWAIESLYSEDKPGRYGYPSSSEASMVLPGLGARGQELIMERARARLSGKPVPELPSADKVDEDGRRKLIESVLAAPDVAATLAKLTMDEQLALSEVGRTNKAVNVKLRPLADSIVEVKIPAELKSAAALEGKLKGRKFDRETVRLLLDASLQLVREGHSFTASIVRRPGATGTSVVFNKAADESTGETAAYYAMMGMPGASTNRQIVAGVSGWMAGGRHNAYAWWPARDPARVAGVDASGTIETRLLDEAEAEMRAISERQQKNEQESFWVQVDQMLEKSGAFLSMSVTLSGEAEKSAAPAGK